MFGWFVKIEITADRRRMWTSFVAFLIICECVYAFHLARPGMRFSRIGLSATSVATDRFVRFGAIKISNKISNRLKNKGILQPSGIQITSLNPVQAGTSCILHAATGTGKTLCFSLPIMSKQLAAVDHRRPLQTLVIVPSKDLCAQVTSLLLRSFGQTNLQFS